VAGLSENGACTRMYTLPSVPAGATAVITLSDATVKLAAGVEPNSTEVAPVRPAPLVREVIDLVTAPATSATASNGQLRARRVASAQTKRRNRLARSRVRHEKGFAGEPADGQGTGWRNLRPGRH